MAPVKFTRKELEKRNHREDAAIIIDNVVYDITDFLDDHPGGIDVLLNNAGKDASEGFHEVRHSDIGLDWLPEFMIGEVVDEDRWEVKTREPSEEYEDPDELLFVWVPRLVVTFLTVLIYMYLYP